MVHMLVSKMKLGFVVILYFSLVPCLNGDGGRRSSREEDFELEKILERLNKPAVISIQRRHGDIYDCVDFYKQPAFDHPLLQNHNFHYQMKPSSYPKRNVLDKEDSSSGGGNLNDMARKGIDCPFGTVPLRRITKADLIRAKTHGQMHYFSNHGVQTIDRPGVHVAIVRTKYDARRPGSYYGVGMEITLEMPKANESQYSMGKMSIQNGPDILRSGWMVNPTLYGDNRTRFFISTKVLDRTCFNVLCPGFVLVRGDHPVDEIAEPISHNPPGPVYAHPFTIYRDNVNGNWWLQRGDIDIGFWPGRIFTGLMNPATYVDWGGETSSPLAVMSPPMGRGDFPMQDVRFDAYCRHITIVNDKHELISAPDTEEYADKEKNYYPRDQGDIKGFGHLISYGGSGGAIGY